MEDIEIKKEKLRKEYKSIRSNVNNKIEKSRDIANKLVRNENFEKAKVLAVYKSLGTEVDTTELINYSISIGKTVVLPKVEGDELKFYKVNSINENFIKSSFGVEEPLGNESNLVDKTCIDLLIVPGLCFDREKNRLGFGRGYYDRYLKNEDLKTIGICFDEQILEKEILPITEDDVKLDEIITDKRNY